MTHRAQDLQTAQKSVAEQGQGAQETTMTDLPTITSTILADVLSFSPDALLVVDMDGNITAANGEAAILFGYQQDELPGRVLECLLPERFRQSHLTHRLAYAA